MAAENPTESIADRVAQSLAAFEAINTVEIQAELGDSEVSGVQMIGDQLSKFKLWAGNIAAHRTGRSSLDYRLRDSSHLHAQVMRLLADLITSLHEMHSILSGETLPWDQDHGEASELDDELKDLLANEDFEFNSELSQLTREITDTVGSLLRLSISLRNPAPHDRFMSNEYAKVHYFEANDKAHVEAKFPSLSQTLVKRLGQALSMRRQYFRYRKSHHEKLARGLFDSGRSEAGAQSTIASSIPIAMRVHGALPSFGELDEDERSDTGFSQTSFATTAPESNQLRIPPLPRRAYDGPFECRFCFMLISVSSTHQWKKHVLRDLRPYICLAEDCTTASREYSRRHEWMYHMFQKHWKSWTCPYQCGLDSTTELNLHQHISRIHGSKTDMEVDALIAKCSRTLSISPSSPVECPFCQVALESSAQYQRHVGRHQVDLALFALPDVEDDDEEPDEANADQETISTHSGSYSEARSDDISPRRTPSPTPSGLLNAHEEPITPRNDTGPWVFDGSSERVSHESTREDAMGRVALAEQTETITELYPEGHEGENVPSKLRPSEDSVEERQDSVRFADEMDDIEVKVRHRDSRGNPHRLSPTTKPVTIEREIITEDHDIDTTHYPDIDIVRFQDIDQGITRAEGSNMRDRGLIDELEIKQRRAIAKLTADPTISDDYELVRVSNELEELRLLARVELEKKRRERSANEEHELREAKRELDQIREKIEREELERRIKQKIELDRLKKEEAALAEKRRREQEAEEAVEEYKKKEAERLEYEREYKQRLQETLLQSGLEEKQINALLEGQENQELKPKDKITKEEIQRPTYTRFARRHLSLETLRVHKVDFVLDEDPDYVLVKRWVPEDEQDILWKHTRVIREQRNSKPSLPIQGGEKKSGDGEHI
ncbi:hypothetical protein F5B22DRAFT_611873 [Xylaria bambusicola]|uniref:uncharacterized protein n=1 Tax=Xylaria bambusicola TaxID=326684 RepID=UPI0020073A4F|nr:uncharacterized protein F5B22DRAFT_611873 [Xylaria bambusicola]KAI0513265.1 hypothetical protein F5B22DRAFT_611873 [Xylaria bambusicola]